MRHITLRSCSRLDIAQRASRVLLLALLRTLAIRRALCRTLVGAVRAHWLRLCACVTLNQLGYVWRGHREQAYASALDRWTLLLQVIGGAMREGMGPSPMLCSVSTLGGRPHDARECDAGDAMVEDAPSVGVWPQDAQTFDAGDAMVEDAPSVGGRPHTGRERYAGEAMDEDAPAGAARHVHDPLASPCRIWSRAAPSQRAQAAIGAGVAKQRARELNQRADSDNARKLSPVSSPMKARAPAAPPPSPLRHAGNDAQAQRGLLAQVSELTRTMGAHTRCVDQRLSALDRCIDQRLSALESSAANTNAGMRALESSAADTNAGLRALPERLEPVVKRGAASAVQEASPGLVRAIATGAHHTTSDPPLSRSPSHVLCRKPAQRLCLIVRAQIEPDTHLQAYIRRCAVSGCTEELEQGKMCSVQCCTSPPPDCVSPLSSTETCTSCMLHEYLTAAYL